MISKERLESSAGSRPLVGVTIDAVGLDREFSYSVPDELEGKLEAGAPVVVSVHGRKRRGWVTSVDAAPAPGRLLPISSLDDYPLPPELFALCVAAARRYASSPVHFLKHARSAAHGLPSCLLGPAAAGDDLGMRYLRLSPCDSAMAVVAGMAGSAARSGRRSLVLLGTEIEAAAYARGLAGMGLSVVLLTRALPKYKREAEVEADCVVATRIGVFAPVARLGLIVVVDPEDKAHRNQGEPTWRSSVVAAERAGLARIAAVMMSGYPSPESAQIAKVMKPRDEAGCWPATRVVELDGRPAALVTDELADWVRSLLGEATPSSPVALLLNRKGRVNRYACRKCRAQITCERCGAMMAAGPPYTEPGKDIPAAPLHHYSFATETGRRGFDTLFARGLLCPRCGLVTPAACGNCKSTSIAPVSVGTGRIADELKATLGLEAVLADDTTPAGFTSSSGLVVATEAALTRLSAAAGVAFVDFDRYHFSSSFAATNRIFRAWYKASVLIRAGAGECDKPRLLLQTREPGSEIVSRIVNGDPAGLLAADVAERKRLDLPPFSAVALLRTEDAQLYSSRLAQLAAEEGGSAAEAEIAPLSADKLLVKASDHQVLLACLALRSKVGLAAVVHVDPEEL